MSASGGLEDRPSRHCRNPVGIGPEQPPVSGTWPSAQSGRCDAVDAARRSHKILFDEHRVHKTKSVSKKIPRFLTEDIRMTGTPSIDHCGGTYLMLAPTCYTPQDLSFVTVYSEDQFHLKFKRHEYIFQSSVRCFVTVMSDILGTDNCE